MSILQINWICWEWHRLDSSYCGPVPWQVLVYKSFFASSLLFFYPWQLEWTHPSLLLSFISSRRPSTCRGCWALWREQEVNLSIVRSVVAVRDPSFHPFHGLQPWCVCPAVLPSFPFFLPLLFLPFPPARVTSTPCGQYLLISSVSLPLN